MMYNSVSDLVFAIAQRAKKLAAQSKFELQLTVAPAECTTTHAVKADALGKSRGDLIEEILCEEFDNVEVKEL
jgi:hypothetical protein